MQAFEVWRGDLVVAQGAVFASGACVVAWLGEHRSVAVYQDLAAAVAVHGHHGTEFVRIADVDGQRIMALQTNRVQDECEGVGVDARPSTNAGYFWDERDKLLSLLERAPMVPVPTTRPARAGGVG